MQVGQPLGDKRAMAGSRAAFDAEQRGDAVAWQRRYDGSDIHTLEYLGGVAANIFGGEVLPRALADALAIVLGVLELAQLGGRRQLPIGLA